MASPGTKDPPNIYRLVFFSPSIVFILRPRATVPPPLPIASSRLHVPLSSLAISASGPARASPVPARRPDPDPSPSSSPSPRSDLDLPRPHRRRRSSSSSSPALSPAPRARMPRRALVVPFLGVLVVVPFVRALVVVPIAARSSSSLRDHVRPAPLLELVPRPRRLALRARTPRPGRLHALVILHARRPLSSHRACARPRHRACARRAICEQQCAYECVNIEKI